MAYSDFEPCGNEFYGAKKPVYSGILNGNRWDHKWLWKTGQIPYFGLLASRYKRGNLDAFDIIFSRYVRRYQLLFPDEVRKFTELFLEKHPEASNSRYIKTEFLCNYTGIYWDSKYNNTSALFGRYGLFNDALLDDKKIKKAKTQQQKLKFLTEFFGQELYKIKRNQYNAINNRHRNDW